MTGSEEKLAEEQLISWDEYRASAYGGVPKGYNEYVSDVLSSMFKHVAAWAPHAEEPVLERVCALLSVASNENLSHAQQAALLLEQMADLAELFLGMLEESGHEDLILRSRVIASTCSKTD